jgi:hypothetical protein
MEELTDAESNGAVTDLPAIGSGLQQLHGNHYLSVTDRGPTFDRSAPSGSKAFPLPQFNPTIVVSQVIGDQIVPTDYLPIVNDFGDPITGLPNGPMDDAQGYLTAAAPVSEQLPPVIPATSAVILDVNVELPAITDFKLDFGIGDVPGRSSKVWQILLSRPLR